MATNGTTTTTGTTASTLPVTAGHHQHQQLMLISALERKLKRLKRQTKKSKRQLGQLEEELGDLYYQTGQYERARDMLAEAHAVYVGLEDGKSEAYVLSCIANCHFKLRAFPLAREHYLRSLECARQMGDVVSEVKQAYNMALCDSRLGKWTEASNGFDKAFKIASANPEETGTLMAFVQCAVAFVKQNQSIYRDAVGRYREGLSVLSDDPSLAFFALTNMGVCYDKMSQPEAAHKEFSEALDIAMAANLPLRDQLRALFDLAMVELQLGRPLEALSLLQEAERCEQQVAKASHQLSTAGGTMTTTATGTQQQHSNINTTQNVAASSTGGTIDDSTTSNAAASGAGGGGAGGSSKAHKPSAPKFSKGLDPSCAFLRSTIAAYLAQLTLTCEVRVAHMVQPVLDRVLEYCDTSTTTTKAAQREEGGTGAGTPPPSSRRRGSAGTAAAGGGGAHPTTTAMVLNIRAILQAIEGESDEALELMAQVKKTLTDNKLEPPPLPASFLPEVWATEAVTFPVDDASLRHGPERNTRMYLRRGGGMGAMGEAGIDGSSLSQLKKARAAIKASLAQMPPSTTSGQQQHFPFGKDKGDTCVSELQMAYCMHALQEEGGGAAGAAAASPRAAAGARASLESALMAAKQKNDKVLIAATLRCMADLSREEGDLYGELLLLKQHEQIVRNFKDQGWYADCCRRLVSVYTRITTKPPPPLSPKGGRGRREGGDGGGDWEGVDDATDGPPLTVRSEGEGRGAAEGGGRDAAISTSMEIAANNTMRGGEGAKRGGVLMMLQSRAAMEQAGLSYDDIERRSDGSPGNEVWVHQHGRQLAHFYLQMYKELQGQLGWYFNFRS